MRLNQISSFSLDLKFGVSTEEYGEEGVVFPLVP